jgi:hypothetical protein
LLLRGRRGRGKEQGYRYIRDKRGGKEGAGSRSPKLAFTGKEGKGMEQGVREIREIRGAGKKGREAGGQSLLDAFLVLRS